MFAGALLGFRVLAHNRLRFAAGIACVGMAVTIMLVEIGLLMGLLNAQALVAAQPSPQREQITIQVEVENLDELREALAAGALSVLVDNFDYDMMRAAVAMNKELAKGEALLEVSGGVTLDQLRDIAVTGVDRISIGKLTKDVKAVDFSLRVLERIGA